MNGTTSINNKRAKFAYDELHEIRENKSQFRSLARSFPTMVQVNGLTAAVAFLFSKKGEHKMMYDIIYKWLKSSECICKCDEGNLMASVIEMDSKDLQLTTAEVMALLVWIKRFAEGMFETDV